MKAFGTSLLIALLTATIAAAQPQVAYIIPDIGAPGMNTYVEIVAPVTATGSFGNFIPFFLNDGNETVSVQPANAADNNRIVVGPLVVSWESRLISTQVFVKPGAANGVVPLRVTVNGQSTNVDFEIVTPQKLGTAANGVLSGGGVLGSGGIYGTRSRRGAMIVESMVLNGGTYSGSLTDPDGSTGGNQAYLPLIIISKGIVALSGNATLHVNGGIRDAGPGGGGGGGRYCDQTFFGDGGPGEDGGPGFTSGGAGGRNHYQTGDTRQNLGQSSGTSGASLNGVAAGGYLDCNNFESAGGGTGHPFGVSGQGPCYPVQGRYGGGSAANQNAGGGGGGYGTDGANASGTNGGRIHGNRQGVPVAGGSGGSSGNPQSAAGQPFCAGSGGGGGGALVVYSHDIFNNTGAALEARGGNGAGGNGNAGGGAGSGGYIGMGAKVRASFGGTLNVAGGNPGNSGGTGGRGRARFDGAFTASQPNIQNSGTSYIGPTIDTLSYVQSKTFTITGTYNGADQINVYLRSDNGVWTFLPGVTLNAATRTWQVPATVQASGLYYVCAMQLVPGPSGTQYQNEPGFAMSQAAANIIKVDLIARINVDRTTINFGKVYCSETITDSVRIWNSGDDTLRINPSLFSGADFSIVSPTGLIRIPPAPGDTMIVMKLRFNPVNAPNGLKVDTLILSNNDPRPGKNPTKIVLMGERRRVTQSIPASLDGGPFCRDTGTATGWSFNLTHTGDTTAQIKSITRLGTGPQIIRILSPTPSSLPVTVPAGTNQTHTFQVGVARSTAGVFSDSFRIVVGPCDSAFIVRLRATVTETSIEVTPNPLDFGDVRVGTSQNSVISIKNIGAARTTVTSVFIRPNGAPFTAPSSLVGTSFAPGETITGIATFSPTVSGPATGQLCVVVGPDCPDTFCIDLRGRGVTSFLVLSRRTLYFEADSCSNAPPTMIDTFKLYNRGGATVKIDRVSTANGLVTVTHSGSITGDLNAGDSISFTVTWVPGNSGTDQIRIETQAEDPAQKLMIVDVILRRERSQLTALAADTTPAPALIDFGTIFNCNATADYRMIIRNTGTLAEDVRARFLSGAAFSLQPTFPFRALAGEDIATTITFRAPAPGIYNDTLVIANSSCPRELRIPVTGTFYDITFSATGFNFGSVNIGTPTTGTVTLTNTSSTPNNLKAHVSQAFIRPAGTPFTLVTPIDLPKDLAPNEVTSVDVSFNPTAQATYNAEVCFKIDTPCDTTICVPIDGTGIKANIVLLQSSLNFGTKYICEDDSLSVTMINTGTAPIQLTSIGIAGNDPAAFEQSPAVAMPRTLQPNETLAVQVKFFPARAANDGLLRATLEIRTDDPQQPLVNVQLIGERRRQALSTPTQVAFGRVEIGTSDERLLTLENRTDAPMRISALELSPGPYTIISPSTPLVIPPLDSIIVRIRFTPVDSNDAPATLIARQETPCPDSTTIAITGRGKLIQTGGAVIVLSSALTGQPGERLAIPILLTESRLIAESEAKTFRAQIRFNATMLHPLRVRAKGEAFGKGAAGSAVTTGQLISSKIEGGDRVVTLEIQNDPVPAAPDTLGFLDVVVLLGDTTVTPVTIDTLFWTDGRVNTTTTNGLFTLQGYCTVGGNRLLKAGTGFGIKAVAPNPFNPTAEIIFETIEEGPTSLAIYDLYGRRVATLIEGESLPAGGHMRTWEAGAFPSGIYHAVLISTSERSIYRLVLAK